MRHQADDGAGLVRHPGDVSEGAVRVFGVAQEHLATSISQIVLSHLYPHLPREEWRIEAMLRHYDEGWDWSEEGERREGSLLGYTEYEIEAWLDHLRKSGTIKVS